MTLYLHPRLSMYTVFSMFCLIKKFIKTIPAAGLFIFPPMLRRLYSPGKAADAYYFIYHRAPPYHVSTVPARIVGIAIYTFY